MRTIRCSWDADDVMSVAPGCSEPEAEHILKECQEKLYDAMVNAGWTTIKKAVAHFKEVRNQK